MYSQHSLQHNLRYDKLPPVMYTTRAAWVVSQVSLLRIPHQPIEVILEEGHNPEKCEFQKDTAPTKRPVLITNGALRTKVDCPGDDSDIEAILEGHNPEKYEFQKDTTSTQQSALITDEALRA